jgi:hypothetical protein
MNTFLDYIVGISLLLFVVICILTGIASLLNKWLKPKDTKNAK